MLKPDIGLMIWTFISFVLLLSIMIKFGYKPITTLLKKREDTIKEILAEVEKKGIVANESLKDAEKVLDTARMDAKKIVEESQKEAVTTAKKTVDTANEEAEKLIERAKTEAEIEKSRTGIEIRKMAAEIGIEIAGKIVKKSITPADHTSVLTDSVNEVLSKFDISSIDQKSDEILMSLRSILDTEKTDVKIPVELTTVYPITSELQEDIKKKITDLLKREVELKISNDESILGGVILKVKDTIIDNSIKKKLEELNKKLAGV